MGCSYEYVVSLRYKLAVGVFIAGMPIGAAIKDSLWLVAFQKFVAVTR
jgi:hypothetical protein